MSDQKIKVLVVEDEPTLNQLIGTSLSLDPGFEVTLTLSGPEALEELKTLTPDMVILDLIMPGMSGFEVLEQFRSDTRFDQTACIIFTNLNQTSDRDRARELGADNYFIKSDVDLPKLKVIVRNEIAKRRERLEQQGE